MVLLCANLVSFLWPRTCVVADSLTTKLDANAEAWILWSSLQLQMNVAMRSGPSTGYEDVSKTIVGVRTKLTRRSWTAPQKHVAVALPSGCTPLAPSEGNSILELLIVGDSKIILLRLYTFLPATYSANALPREVMSHYLLQSSKLRHICVCNDDHENLAGTPLHS